MSAGPGVETSFFEALYREHEDPWGFASRSYESHRYAAMLAALGARRFECALEVGCSIGVFTERLVPRCAILNALDASPTAVERARDRLTAHPGARVVRARVPDELPEGPFDLVVCADVLYYLSADALAGLLPRLEASLTPGGMLLAAHWRGPTAPAPLTGDEVHEQLLGATALHHSLDGSERRFRLDLLERR